MTAKGQTTLPRDVRTALQLQPGDKLRYLMFEGEVRILKARPVMSLEGTLKRPGQDPVSIDKMDEDIAASATAQTE